MPNLMEQAISENRSGRLEDRIEQLETRLSERLDQIEKEIDRLRLYVAISIQKRRNGRHH